MIIVEQMLKNAQTPLLHIADVIHWRLTTYLHLKHGRNNYFLGEEKYFK